MPAFTEPGTSCQSCQTGQRLRRPGRRRGDMAPGVPNRARTDDAGHGPPRADAPSTRSPKRLQARLRGAGQAGTHRYRGRPRPPLEKPTVRAYRPGETEGVRYTSVDTATHRPAARQARRRHAHRGHISRPDPQARSSGSRLGSLTGCGMPDQPVHRHTTQSVVRSVSSTGNKAARRWRQRILRDRGRRAARRPTGLV